MNTYEYNSLAICIFNLINYVYCHHARLVVVAIFCSEYSMTSCCMLFTVTISSALTASPFYSATPAPGQGHTADIWAHHYSYSDMRSSLSNIKIVPSENRGASVKNFWIWQRLKKSEKRCKRWDGGRQNRGEGSDMTPPPPPSNVIFRYTKILASGVHLLRALTLGAPRVHRSLNYS